MRRIRFQMMGEFQIYFDSCNGPPGICFIRYVNGTLAVVPQLGLLLLKPMILP